MKSILNYISFLHRWIWCDEKVKKYVIFYVYFSRMQNVFISDVESFFRELFFSGKNWFCFNVFCQCFFKGDWWWLFNTYDFILSFFHFSMQREHSQTEVLAGYEMNAYRRRLFSNCFNSRSNDTSWTFIYKYLDL